MFSHLLIYLATLLQASAPSLGKSIAVDLGNIAYGTEKQFEVLVENVSDQPWKITTSVQNCKCFRLALPRVIGAGESVSAVGHFRPSKIGKFEQKHIVEGDFGALEITVKGECFPLFTLDKTVYHSKEETSVLSLRVQLSELLNGSSNYLIQVRGDILRGPLNFDVTDKIDLPILVDLFPKQVNSEFSRSRIDFVLIDGNKPVVANESVTVVLDDRIVISPKVLKLDGARSKFRVFVSNARPPSSTNFQATIRSELDSEFSIPIKVPYLRMLANSTLLIGLDFALVDYRSWKEKKNLFLELSSDEFSHRIPIQISIP